MLNMEVVFSEYIIFYELIHANRNFCFISKQKNKTLAPTPIFRSLCLPRAYLEFMRSTKIYCTH